MKIHFSLTNNVALRWVLPVVLFIVGACVVLSTVFSVYGYGSSVLFGDQWYDFRYIKSYYNGDLHFVDLFNQHNEHRIFFPRLIFFIDYFVSNADNRFSFLISVVVQFGTLFGVGAIYWKNEKNLAVFISLIALASIFLFSLNQRENFMWGFQVGFLGVVTATVAAFFFFSISSDREARGLSPWGYRILSYLMAFVATYTLSNGILCAVILVPLAIVQRCSRFSVGITALCAAILAFSYFAHFQPVPYHAPYSYSLEHPAECARYVTAYLGASLGLLNQYMGLPLGVIPIGFGFAGIILSMAALWRVISVEGDGCYRSALVAVILFLLGTAMLTALGRVTFGLGQAFAGRYLTPVSVFWVAHIFYWASLRTRLARGAALIRYGGPIFVLPIAISCTLAHVGGWHGSIASFLSYNRVRDALLSDVLADDVAGIVNVDNEMILSNLGFLRQHRLSVFAPADNRILGQVLATTFPVATAGACLGFLDAISAASSTGPQVGLMADGWAWDARAKHRVDRIFITNAAGAVIGFGSGGWSRPDVPKALPEVRVDSVGWKGFLKAGPNEVVRAYALLADHRVCQFAERPASVD